jgi:RsiW-degrading membrane proteinase PrsW (M82 family)
MTVHITVYLLGLGMGGVIWFKYDCMAWYGQAGVGLFIWHDEQRYISSLANAPSLFISMIQFSVASRWLSM